MNTGTPVESPVRGDSHAGFGGRPAETERPKGRHRAAGRPYLATDALDVIRREVWNDARRAGQTQLARELKGARFALWKNPENLTARQQAKLSDIQRTNRKLTAPICSKSSCARSTGCRPPARPGCSTGG